MGTGGYAAAQWLLLMMLSRWGGASPVGQFTLALATSAPVLAATNLQLRVMQATDTRLEFTFGQYLGLRLAMSSAALVSILAIAGVMHVSAETRWVILFVGLAKCVEAISDVAHGAMQRIERLDLVGRSLLIKAAVILSIFPLALFASGSLKLASAAFVVAWLLLLLGYDLRVARSILLPADSSAVQLKSAVLLRLLRSATPLGVTAVMFSITQSVPRFALQHFGGEEWVGIYSALAYVLVGGMTFVTAVGQTLMPRLAALYSARSRDFFRLQFLAATGAGAIATLSMLAAYLYGEPILKLLYGANFGADAPTFALVVASAVFWYPAWFINYGVSAAREYRKQVPVFAAVLVTALCLSLALVPDHGPRGAAIAMGAASLVQLLGFAALNRGLHARARDWHDARAPASISIGRSRS